MATINFLALITTVITLAINIISPLILMVITLCNEYLKRKDKNRFLSLENSQNIQAILLYFTGFFVIIATPLLIGSLTVIIIKLIDIRYRIGDMIIVSLPVSVMILISIIYILILARKIRIDDIKSLGTLKYSFVLMQLIILGLILFEGLILFSSMFNFRLDEVFCKVDLLLILGLAGLIFMPFILFFNVISHISKPVNKT
ncbi:MAG TPA: hypothetical protein PL110_10700 [Candidatus Eremiobacteraeota bacterium]|nr:MAG: hypothetical protein BWY64_03352 [bacterium ADurb.Bin363]HPZ08572.1 hypothetical protein [Candidatus Eremiobacteraeota bacterium]